MYLKSMEISGIAGIEHLHLNFNRGMNIICGPNGIGKTTILECIAQSFSGDRIMILRRRALSETGQVKAKIHNDPTDLEVLFATNTFLPIGDDYSTQQPTISKYLLSLKISRTFKYTPLSAVARDSERSIHTISTSNKIGVNLDEVKNWFVNRYLYAPHGNALTQAQQHNLSLSKQFFGLLNSDYSFSRVDASSNEIMINTPAGEIYYEYLSSGFKSCISILFGVVKELEFRFGQEKLKADEFNGVILIDELELHLHPEWQAKISKVLTTSFPCSQFVVTTHSPHIIQAARPDEVLALECANGKVYMRDLPDTKYGFQGWSVEEVLKDVMGMSDIRTPIYHETLNRFRIAVDNDCYDEARIAFDELDDLLHPENHLRKLLAFQLGALKG